MFEEVFCGIYGSLDELVYYYYLLRHDTNHRSKVDLQRVGSTGILVILCLQDNIIING